MSEKPEQKERDKSKEMISNLESPFVFISHDTRDAEIAEAFSKLLKSVSAGMLKSFRSSDNKGTQGIEFGIEWYPKIIESLQDSSDVVCILTDLSVDRPWILFEAGMAKGKLNTPILGVAVGIPLSTASSGPFAQFQNCSDDVSSLTKLVNQLVKKLPNSEPDEDVIKQQVEIFRTKTQEIISNRAQNEEQDSQSIDANESAKLFEEVKLMFKELPSRIENISRREPSRSHKRFHPGILEEMMHVTLSRGINPKIVFQMILSPIKNELPWIYEAGIELLDKVDKVKNIESTKAFKDFIKITEFTFDGPMMREFFRDEYDYRYYRELPYMIHSFIKELQYRKEDSESIL